jgi:hypothetical protein
LWSSEIRWKQRRSAGLLRTEGIACDHRHTDVGAGAGDAVGDSGPREILVARDDLERARQLVTADAS